VTDAGPKIKAENKMRRGQSGLCGGGIYFADSIEAAKSKAHTRGYIVTAMVRVGKAKVLDLGDANAELRMTESGCDSVELRGRPNGIEYVVYNPDQIELISVCPE